MMSNEFYENEYNEYFDYANKNNLLIREIQSDNNIRKFKLIEKIENENDKRTIRYNNLKSWFESFYPKEEQKLRRLHVLNKLTDDGKNPYEELITLYEDAEKVRKEIQELEQFIL